MEHPKPRGHASTRIATPQRVWPSYLAIISQHVSLHNRPNSPPRAAFCSAGGEGADYPARLLLRDSVPAPHHPRSLVPLFHIPCFLAPSLPRLSVCMSACVSRSCAPSLSSLSTHALCSHSSYGSRSSHGTHVRARTRTRAHTSPRAGTRGGDPRRISTSARVRTPSPPCTIGARSYARSALARRARTGAIRVNPESTLNPFHQSHSPRLARRRAPSGPASHRGPASRRQKPKIHGQTYSLPASRRRLAALWNSEPRIATGPPSSRPAAQALANLGSSRPLRSRPLRIWAAGPCESRQ